MGKESMTLRDLFASVVTGNTVNVVQSTTTDLLRAVIKEDAVTTIFTAYTYSYDISGYTVAQAQGVLYNFYVNTGATLKTLNFGATGDTALSTYISGSTLTIPSGVTVTETATPYTGSTTTVTNYLNVNVSGGTGGSYPTSPTFTNVNITGDLRVTGNTYQTDQYIVDELFIGPINTMNSWKFVMSGADLLIQTYSGTGTTYITKSTILG